MEQDITGRSNTSDLPEHLPNDIEEPGSAELAADLVREQATGPVPLGPAIPGQGEDAVLLVETGMLPDQASDISSEDMALGKIDVKESPPWYRSPWLYLGAGLAGGAALAAGTVLLIRNRSARQPRTAIGRAQHRLNRWSNQLSWQTGRLSGQIGGLTSQMRIPARRRSGLMGRASRFTGQAGKLTGQAQGQISRLTGRTQRTTLRRLPLQRQNGANRWMKQTRRQLTNLSQQAGDQLSAIGSAVGTTTRATTAQAIGRTQDSLAQVRQGVAAGAARTGKGIKSGWKFSRNFTIGLTTGAVWAALFTPQSGETTRQRLKALVPARWRGKR